MLRKFPEACRIFIRNFQTSLMANSKYEYVKQFEQQEACLPNTWIVVRVDGRGFHRFSDEHKFEKPNDVRALNLMNRSAKYVMDEFKDIVLGFGHSDEYSFIFRKETEVYKRRSAKLLTYVCSAFTSAYVFNWCTYFKEPMLRPPVFDGRVVLYPSDRNLRDYLAWRQADTHINNLYNTCFWNLVLKKNMSNDQAQQRLSGTFSSDKNELLFQEFGINYNNEPEIYKKGTTIVRKGNKLTTLNVDIIKDEFWNEYSHILSREQQTTQTSKAKQTEVPYMGYIPTNSSTQTSVNSVTNALSQTILSDNHIETQTSASDNHIQTQTSYSDNHICTQTIHQVQKCADGATTSTQTKKTEINHQKTQTQTGNFEELF